MCRQSKDDANIHTLIRQLEQEMESKQKALDHLKEAAKLIGLDRGSHEQHKNDDSGNVEKPTVASIVDMFLNSQTKGNKFTIDDVASAVNLEGIEATESVRRTISAVLSRRAKGRVVKKVERGKFMVPQNLEVQENRSTTPVPSSFPNVEGAEEKS